MDIALGLLLFGVAYLAAQSFGGGADETTDLPDPEGEGSGGGLIATLKPLIPSLPPTLDPGLSPMPSGPGGGSNFGNPPNPSQDPAGYNSEMFPGHVEVRSTLNSLGYINSYQVNALAPAGVVKDFQSDYNEAAAENFGDAEGALIEDGIPGKNTLRALEIAARGQDGLTFDDIARVNAWFGRFHT